MVLTSTEFALINFDGLVRTTYLDGAPLQKNQHGFPVEYPQVCDSSINGGLAAGSEARYFTDPEVGQ